LRLAVEVRVVVPVVPRRYRYVYVAPVVSPETFLVHVTVVPLETVVALAVGAESTSGFVVVVVVVVVVEDVVFFTSLISIASIRRDLPSVPAVSPFFTQFCQPTFWTWAR
jgi:hypothetical protein